MNRHAHDLIIHATLPPWLRIEIEDALHERLGFIKQRFATSCVVGSLALPDFIPQERVQTAVDRMAGFLAVGVKETLNHVRHLIAHLRPEGAFVFACLGDGTLHAQRLAMIEGDLGCSDQTDSLFPTLPTAQHVIDTLHACGVALPVVDGEMLTYTYRSHVALIRDCAPLLGMSCGDGTRAHTYVRTAAKQSNLRQAAVRVFWLHGWKS